MATPFKMKGSPMQRNFGIGSPLHQAELDNPDVETKTKSTKRVDKSRSRLLAGGDASKLTYTTRTGDEVEALDVIKKSKKVKKVMLRKLKKLFFIMVVKVKLKEYKKLQRAVKSKLRLLHGEMVSELSVDQRPIV